MPCKKCTREFERMIDERIEFYKINFYEDAEEHMKVFNLAARELLKELRAKLRAGYKGCRICEATNPNLPTCKEMGAKE